MVWVKCCLLFDSHSCFDQSMPFAWVLWFLGSAGSAVNHSEHVLEWWHRGSGNSRWSVRQCSWFLRAWHEVVKRLGVYVYSAEGSYRGLRRRKKSVCCTWISRSETNGQDHCIKMGTGTYSALFPIQHHHYNHTTTTTPYWTSCNLPDREYSVRIL